MVLKLNGPLLLAGAGKMGGALLEGLLGRDLDPARVVVQDPAPAPQAATMFARRGIVCSALVTSLPEPPEVLILAIKPQMMDEVVGPLAKLTDARTLVVSIAAGRTIASLEKLLPDGTAVVRAMPNTPAAIGRGITVCVANRHVTPAQKALAEELLASVGEVGWIKDEALMDAVTAVSGSGPAYVFLLAECLAAAAVDAGLDEALALRLARATVAGAGELLHRSALAPSKLRRNVTSQGGTTAAALSVLMAEDGLEALLKRAVKAATQRGRELAG